MRQAADYVPPGGDTLFDRETLPNYAPDERSTRWFLERVADEERLVTADVFFSKDFPNPQPVLSLTIRLKYKMGGYSPVYGQTEGYLHLTTTIASLTRAFLQVDDWFSGKFALVDDEGVILNHTDPEMIGDRIETRMSALEDYYIFKHPLLQNRLFLYTFASKTPTRNTLGIVNDLTDQMMLWTNRLTGLSSNMNQQLDELQQRVIMVALLAFGAALVIIFLVSRHISRPLGNLAHTAMNIARGRLEKGPVLRHWAGREIGILAGNLETMRLNIKDQIDNLDRIVGERTRQLEEAKAMAETASQAKSDFLAHMSHEIRTPLNALIGAAEVLGETDLAADQVRIVRLFQSSGEHLLHLVEDILDLSRIESGKLILERLPFDPGEEIRKCCRIMEMEAGEKNLEIGCRIDPTLPPVLVGDPARLRQILVNLIGNAVKFTERGRIWIEAALPEDEGATGAADTAGRVTIHFTVSDSGIGIPKDKQKCIFAEFTQADTGVTRKYGGTGLGLAITRSLVEMMNGDIWLESEPGQGSRFHFTARLELPDSETAAQGLHDTSRFEPQNPVRILLVDDYDHNRLIIQSHLRHPLVRIDTAENGSEALSLFKENRYDLVLMDIQMPVMDGFTATREIRAHEGRNNLAPTPVIALTAYAFGDDIDRSLEAGCSGHLPKPIRKSRLIEMAVQQLSRPGTLPLVFEEPENEEEAGDFIRVRIDPDLQDIAHEFLHDVKNDLLAVLSYLTRNDFENILKICHDVKGAGGSYGLDRVSTMAGEIERLAENGDASGVRGTSEELLDYLMRIQLDSD